MKQLPHALVLISCAALAAFTLLTSGCGLTSLFVTKPKTGPRDSPMVRIKSDSITVEDENLRGGWKTANDPKCQNCLVSNNSETDVTKYKPYTKIVLVGFKEFGRLALFVSTPWSVKILGNNNASILLCANGVDTSGQTPACGSTNPTPNITLVPSDQARFGKASGNADNGYDAQDFQLKNGGAAEMFVSASVSAGGETFGPYTCTPNNCRVSVGSKEDKNK